MWTDVLQGLIALIFLVVSAVAFSQWAGGLDAGLKEVQRAMPEKFVFNQPGMPGFIDNVLSWTFAVFLWPHVFQRLFMARDPGHIRRTAVYSFFLLMLVVVCILLMAIAATAQFHGTLDDPDELIVAMFRLHWPTGGVILTLVVFALAMSTIDSVLLTIGSLITRDTCHHLLGIKLSPSAEFILARWATVLFLALGAIVAFSAIGRSAIVPWVTMSASVVTLLLWPLLGTVWKGATRQGVVAAMVFGFLAICLVRFTELGTGLPVGFATVGFLVGGTSFLCVSLLTRGRPLKV